MREITINFPLYSDVEELYVGLDENALVEAKESYNIVLNYNNSEEAAKQIQKELE